jgi:hypothetical protein
MKVTIFDTNTKKKLVREDVIFFESLIYESAFQIWFKDNKKELIPFNPLNQVVTVAEK